MVNRHRGANYPIMNTNERTLSVLSCKYVNDVVIDPPWHMTREMIAALNISIVAHGSTNDLNDMDEKDPCVPSRRLARPGSPWPAHPNYPPEPHQVA